MHVSTLQEDQVQIHFSVSRSGGGSLAQLEGGQSRWHAACGCSAATWPGHTNAVAHEVAWIKVRFQWHFALIHIPAEQNDLEDSLSRLSAVAPRQFPELLTPCTRRRAPDVQDLWRAWVAEDPAEVPGG